MADNYSPIGFFDSGYGGITILEDVKKVLPNYDYLYLGDNARAPYGNRSFDVVYEYTWQSVKELFKRGCNLVIVACNTSSAKALRNIQQINLKDYPNKRVLGVIRPSAEVIGDYSRTNTIGILATEGTVKSESYILEIVKFFPEIQIYQHACPLWVPLIESNDFNSAEGMALIKRDITELLQKSQKIDSIILGCTHYPIIKMIIEKFVPKGINVISQGPIIAEKLKAYLEKHIWLDCLISKHATTRYLTTETPYIFDQNVKSIFDLEISSQYLRIL
jgi:glutamate racemase